MDTTAEELELQSAKWTLYIHLRQLKRGPTDVEAKLLCALALEPHIRDVLQAALRVGGRNEQG